MDLAELYVLHVLRTTGSIHTAVKLSQDERIARGRVLFHAKRNRNPVVDRSPKRLCIITPQFVYGGVERWIEWLAKGFDPARYVLSDLIVRNQNDWTIELSDSLPPNVNMHFGSECISQVTGQCDGCISWGCADLLSMDLAIRCRHVSVVHGASGCDTQKNLCRNMVLCGLPVVAVSGACAVNFDKLPDDYTVIPNGVDPEHVKPRFGRDLTRSVLGIEPGEVAVLMHARLTPEKGGHLLCKAIGRLRGRYRCILAGFHDGDWTGRLKRWQKWARGRAIFLEPVERPGDLLAASDVSVSLSAHESFSFSVVESWMARRPTVCTRTHAYRWFERRHGDLSVPLPIRPSVREVSQAIIRARTLPVDRQYRVAHIYYRATRMVDGWSCFLDRLLTPGQ